MCAILCIYLKAIYKISKQEELGERCYKDHEYAWALLKIAFNNSTILLRSYSYLHNHSRSLALIATSEKIGHAKL